jgi:LysM repeat protein/ABC-type branched-subunit amino acid transport system substrate-binding protein
MKYLPVLVLFVFLSLFPHNQVAAQTTQDKLKQMRSSVIETIDGRDYYIHDIRRGQTLYMISKAYSVEVNDIIRENPGVKDGIKADQKLRILVPGQKTAVIPRPEAGKEKADTEMEIVPVNREIPKKADTVVRVVLPCGMDGTTKKTVYNVALMLPLYLDEVDQIDAANPDPGIFETSKSFRFLPYYEGFRMALDSLEKTGLKIKLYVYDVDKDTSETRLLLSGAEMKSMDLIFGLLYHQNFQIVATYAKQHKINLVNPISERSELVEENPSVFKVQPSENNRLKQLAAYMESAFSDGQILIIRNGQYHDQDAADRMKNECLERNLKVQVVEGQDAAVIRYSKDKPNYVVAFSDKQEYALDLLRGLYKLRNEYDLTLVGLPDWPDMEGLENEYLVSLKTHMMARSFVDYDDLMVKHFVRQYQEIYKADPELLAFQGFDQAFYFLSALRNYGTNIGRCIGEQKISSLQTRFHFTQAEGNGFENQLWRLYKYENYKLVSVY